MGLRYKLSNKYNTYFRTDLTLTRVLIDRERSSTREHSWNLVDLDVFPFGASSFCNILNVCVNSLRQ